MAASNNLLGKVFSSFAESNEPRTSVGRGVLRQHVVALGLLQATHSNQSFRQLAAKLIPIAEHSIGLRDMQTLTEVSEVLLNLPLPEARQAGTYYHALVMKRKNQTDEARAVLQKIADNPAVGYRARAIQTLGVIQQEHSEPNEAGRFYIEAIRAAGKHDLIAVLSAHETISAIKSEDGDHQGALADLENLWPLFRLAAKKYPFYFYVYHADLAYELGQVGRIADAEAACKISLAYPFTSAYPEWTETRQELEAKRTSATPSVVAITRPPEAEPSPQLEPQHQSKRSRKLSFSHPTSGKDSSQRSTIPIPAIARATIALNDISILDRVLMCIGPRAPPPESEPSANNVNHS